MARKRQRRRAQATAASLDNQGHHATDNNINVGNGVTVHKRQIQKTDEGVLYTHRITERKGHPPKRFFSNPLRRRDHSDTHSVSSVRSTSSFKQISGAVGNTFRRTISGGHHPRSPGQAGFPLSPMSASMAMSPPPQSETLMGYQTFFGKHHKQYTIAPKKKYRNNFLNWLDKNHLNIIDYCRHGNVDNNVYRPSTSLYRYIDWTFTAGFTSVFMSFLVIYLLLCLAFGGLLLVAGNAEPNCIVATGAPFGQLPHTAWSDAFALSWTTFTTVGYGMTYTSTASDFDTTGPHECTWVVFLSTTEAFLGLLFAGMCAAILFGKVNRVQSHANIIFCNAVCLQYEEMEDDIDEDYAASERSTGRPPIAAAMPMSPKSPHGSPPIPELEEDVENQKLRIVIPPQSPQEESKFVDQFNGCPILKFQVVNELCNREGGELVDCIMKVVGIKFKGPNGSVTHSQYVRVNLVDFEHPFLSRVWHGVHILDSTSPLLTDRARQRIRENNGSWPGNWFDPDVIRSKLEFNDLIVTVAGISNVSAVTVHAYKRYKIGDVLIGFNFAPIVFRDVETGRLEVDMSMCNDVREQYGLRGEDLSVRRTDSKEFDLGPGPGNLHKMVSTIRIKKSKSGDALGSVNSHHSGSSKPAFGSPEASIAENPVELVDEAPVSPLETEETEDEEIGQRKNSKEE